MQDRIEGKKGITIRLHEDLLGKESPYSHILQLSCFIVFMSVWILDSFVFKLSMKFANHVPWFIRIALALILIAIGVTMGYLAQKVLFHQEHDTPSVIDIGVYAHVRHPLYLAGLLVYLGFVLGTFSILSLITYIFVFLVYDYLATFEEKDLERVLGQAYVEYKRKIPKWIPNFLGQK
jgi:protein-S-isoprenylcysteine O-methyltransferase Ste14